MRFLHTGDWHLGVNIDNYITKDNVNLRLEEQKRSINQMVDYAISKKVDVFSIDGDLFHSCRPSPIYMALAIEIIHRLVTAGVRVVVLKGNHDHSQSSASALEPIKEAFAGTRHVLVVDDEPIAYDEYVFVPHGCDTNSLPKGKYLVGHFHMDGAVSGAERQIMVGADHVVSKVPAGIKRVILGHIHMPQEFIVKGIPVDYTGSIVRIDFGEREDEKSFMIHDTETNKLERIPLDCVEYMQLEMTEDVLARSPEADVDGKIVKLTVTDYSGGISVEEIQQWLEQRGALLIKAIVLNRKDGGVAVVRDSGMAGLSPMAAMERYFAEDTDKDWLMKAGAEILEEATNG